MRKVLMVVAIILPMIGAAFFAAGSSYFQMMPLKTANFIGYLFCSASAILWVIYGVTGSGKKDQG